MSKRKTLEQFIEEANNVHKNFYSYEHFNYVNNHTKGLITCPTHGDFLQRPKDHLRGNGCPHPSHYSEAPRITNEEFIKKITLIHGDTYDYSLVNYKNVTTKIEIICKKCGKHFWQSPRHHLSGHGCPFCAGLAKLTLEDFIEKSNKVHNYFYKYNNIKEIKNNREKVSITCPVHGDFLMRPNNHLMGQGCPRCNQSHGENKINNFLIEHNIKFEREKRFDGCRNIRPLPFDFYLLELNTCIEYDGEQHFNSIEAWGGEKKFKNLQSRDIIKNQFCFNNNIKLIRIKYNENIEEKLSEILL